MLVTQKLVIFSILYNNSVTKILKQSPSSSNQHHCGRFWYLIFEKISPLNLYISDFVNSGEYLKRF